MKWTRETRTGLQEVRVSLPRVDALLDQPRYSLPEDVDGSGGWAARPQERKLRVEPYRRGPRAVALAMLCGLKSRDRKDVVDVSAINGRG